MTIGQSLNQSIKSLKSKSTSPQLDAEVLLAFVLHKPKEYLYLNPEKKLLRNQLRNYLGLIKLRALGKPVAYLTGRKTFYGQDFKVKEDVLIPRPDTEGLVDLAAAEIKNLELKIKDQPLKILDLGTGSGCIIISLAKQFSNSRELGVKFFASDVSAKALAVARLNARHHKVKVKFNQGSLLRAWKKEHFDIIVANLPYGWDSWKRNPSADTIGLQFEPARALFAQEGGLYLIRRLLEQVSKSVRPVSTVLLEYDPRQTRKLKKLAKIILPWYRLEIHRDLSGKNRYAVLKLQ